MASRVDWSEHDGHRSWYRVAGDGPALVLIRQNRVPKNDPQLGVFTDRFTVLQVTPVGFGASDRPPRAASGGIGPHILQVLEREEIDRFAVWGYSQALRWPRSSHRRAHGRSQ